MLIIKNRPAQRNIMIFLECQPNIIFGLVLFLGKQSQSIMRDASNRFQIPKKCRLSLIKNILTANISYKTILPWLM